MHMLFDRPTSDSPSLVINRSLAELAWKHVVSEPSSAKGGGVAGLMTTLGVEFGPL
jgi:hypothetical protein